MTNHVYLSNLSPAWPIKRQEELLAQADIGYPAKVTVWRESLDPGTRRSHRRDMLQERSNLFRPSARRTGRDVYVASLAVLAWTAEDMLECLTAALTRNDTIHVLDPKLDISPAATAEILHEAVVAFGQARRSRSAKWGGTIGGQISGKRRSEIAKAAAESIRAEWALPSDQYPTAALLDKAGISRNAAKTYLGKRSDAQRVYQATQKRRETPYFKRGHVKV